MIRFVAVVTAAAMAAAVYVARAVHRFEVRWPAELCTTPGTQRGAAARPPAPSGVNVTTSGSDVSERGAKVAAPGVAQFIAPPRDLLQRHLLCQATGLHDGGPDGRCRDCLKVLDVDDARCDDVPFATFTAGHGATYVRTHAPVPPVTDRNLIIAGRLAHGTIGGGGFGERTLEVDADRIGGTR